MPETNAIRLQSTNINENSPTDPHFQIQIAHSFAKAKKSKKVGSLSTAARSSLLLLCTLLPLYQYNHRRCPPPRHKNDTLLVSDQSGRAHTALSTPSYQHQSSYQHQRVNCVSMWSTRVRHCLVFISNFISFPQPAASLHQPPAWFCLCFLCLCLFCQHHNWQRHSLSVAQPAGIHSPRPAAVHQSQSQSTKHQDTGKARTAGIWMQLCEWEPSHKTRDTDQCSTDPRPRETENERGGVSHEGHTKVSPAISAFVMLMMCKRLTMGMKEQTKQLCQSEQH